MELYRFDRKVTVAKVRDAPVVERTCRHNNLVGKGCLIHYERVISNNLDALFCIRKQTTSIVRDSTGLFVHDMRRGLHARTVGCTDGLMTETYTEYWRRPSNSRGWGRGGRLDQAGGNHLLKRPNTSIGLAQSQAGAGRPTTKPSAWSPPWRRPGRCAQVTVPGTPGPAAPGPARQRSSAAQSSAGPLAQPRHGPGPGAPQSGAHRRPRPRPAPP